MSFARCRNLTTINIPANITNIGTLCFYGCKAIKFIEMPNSVNRIGNASFLGCDNLTAIYIAIGSKGKFETLLRRYKDKLVEKK